MSVDINIKVSLSELKYCNGCPLLDMGQENGNKWNWCNKYKMPVTAQIKPLKEIRGQVGRKRLPICIKENKPNQ